MNNKDHTDFHVAENLRLGDTVRVAFFDFDGTLSLLRDGWQQVMFDMMVDALRQTPGFEGEAQAKEIIQDIIWRLTGRPTIEQMRELVNWIVRWGGNPRPADYYKDLFHHRLDQHIRQRIDRIHSNPASADDFLVPGVRLLLCELQKLNITCYLASGGEHLRVVEEVALLGLADFFDGRVQGVRNDSERPPKVQVLERLTKDGIIDGRSFWGFGDSTDDMATIKSFQGTAIGIANGAEWRERLFQAGADIVIPDYSNLDVLAAFFQRQF